MITESYYGNTVTLHYGVHVIHALREIPSESVQCIVTSPPYWGLRNYKTDPQLWPDGWLGELGQEPTPEMFIGHLVLIFRECRRVLRKDGVLFLNIGDSYHGSWGAVSHDIETKAKRTGSTERPPTSRTIPGLKPKDLVMIPAQTALALRADGWYLRAENVWAKPNPMPESVTDRTTRSHEMVYLLTKSRDYFYDHDAVKTPAIEESLARYERNSSYDGSKDYAMKQGPRGAKSDKPRGHSRRHDGFYDHWDSMSKEEQQANGANLRSVWWIATQPYSGSHYATFPEALPELCIKAGSREGDTILDPFMGSGTTAAVALRLNRNVIGIDLDHKNLKLAHARINKSIARDERTISLL